MGNRACQLADRGQLFLGYKFCLKLLEFIKANA